MPEESRDSVASALVSSEIGSSKVMKIARAIALGVTVVGAAPTAYNLVQSYQHGIPYSDVSYRLTQHDLWVKNFDCKIDYKALTTAQGTRVDVGACPKTGDISIKVTADSGQASYEWLAYEKLRVPAKRTSLMDWMIAPALADEKATADAPKGGAFRVAQAGMEVVCQTMVDKSRIIRIVREAGKCYREHFSPFQGKVEKREEVACTTQCSPGK